MKVILSTPSPFRTFALLVLVLIAFAANSVLARIALSGGHADPVSFTSLRLTSGAVLLLCLAGKPGVKGGSAKGGFWLILYALFFSLAYMRLPAGRGALILFAAVQITMIGGGLMAGERLISRQWAGVGLAILGLIWLISPGLERPSVLGAVMMALSGLGWGLYSLTGKVSLNPLADSAGNFMKGTGLLLIFTPLLLWLGPDIHLTKIGVAYALMSGMVTSALGYVLWYHVVKSITSIQAAVSQLSVPVIAAIGGLIFLTEPITWSFAAASVIILTGVALAIIGSRARPKAR